MAKREVFVDRLETLLEPEALPTVSKAPSPKFSLPKLSLPHLNLDDIANYQIVKFLVIRTILVVFLIWFGLSSTGSINGTMASRFSGDLALVFYRWQFGNLLAMIGVVIAYDTLKRFY